MKLITKHNKGITLIALVITIIVLLILVAVTLLTLTGENGILNKGTLATIETYHSTVKEQIILGANAYKIDNTTGKYKNDIIAYLIDNNYTQNPVGITDYDRVQVEIIAKNVKTGKGKLKEDGDIYVIEETDEKYILRYYEKGDKYKDLLYIYKDGTTTNPNPTPSEEEKEIGDIQITYVEDLIDLQIAVNNGDTKSGKVIAVQNNLDFNEDSSYKDAKSTSYGDLNGDKKVEDIKTEILSKRVISIGTEENKFNGTFNGNNYTISNMIINGSDNTAMFMYNAGIIKNLIINKATLVGNNTGSFAYENSGTIENCHIENSTIVHTGGNLAGIVYKNNASGIINNCTNTNVTCIAQGQYSGAGIAVINDGTIKLCTNNTSIKSTSLYSAGITYQNNGTITQCKNIGNISAGPYSGGIVYENNGIVTSCVNIGNITVGGERCGGIIGINKSSDEISGCSNNGNIQATTYTGGIIGLNEAECKVVNCNNYGENLINNGSYVGGIIGCSTTKIIIEDCKNLSSITCKNNYTGGIIGQAVESEIRNCSNAGNIVINNDTYTFAGGIVGGIGGSQTSIIEKCKNTGNIKYGASWAGGIVGRAYDVNIFGCKNEGKLERSVESTRSADNIGGIIGEGRIVNIENCKNLGTIQAQGNDVGGIIGKVTRGQNSNVVKCANINVISGNEYVGGIIGTVDYLDGLKLDQCFNTGDIEGIRQVAGIIGESSYKCDISNVYNSGNISGQQNVGGILGYHESGIINAYNIGNITGYESVGGMIGNDRGNNIEINNVYNAGIISGTSSTGIFIGATGSYNMKNLYYKQSEQNIIGTFQNSSSYLEQITSAQMFETDMKLQTFVNTLNTNVNTLNESEEKYIAWKLDGTTGYPTLDFSITTVE